MRKRVSSGFKTFFGHLSHIFKLYECLFALFFNVSNQILFILSKVALNSTF